MNQDKTSESDEWLMGQVAHGQREHLETLIRRHASPLLTFLHRMLGNLHRAEELFQEVFLAVWVKRKTYKLNKPFRCWLYTIAANRCRADFRRASLTVADPRSGQGHPYAEDEFGADPRTPPPMETVIHFEQAALVERAVAQLPVQQRTVVVMRVWNQMSFAEIASATNLAEGTVRSHMHHALSALRGRLQHQLAPTT